MARSVSRQKVAGRKMPGWRPGVSGLVALGVAIATGPAQSFEIAPDRTRVSTQQYEECAEDLRERQFSPEVAATACARSLKPKDLARCVTRINDDVTLPIGDVLQACRQVRRPVELATCVVDIRANLETAEPPMVLDYCRRSLLPERYSRCVVGLNRAVPTEPPKMMETCIAAGDFPPELHPTFIPTPRE